MPTHILSNQIVEWVSQTICQNCLSKVLLEGELATSPIDTVAPHVSPRDIRRARWHPVFFMTT